jgi:hypothetical protein
VSSPKAIASAPTTTAPPSARRIHFFRAERALQRGEHRPPSSSAAASDTRAARREREQQQRGLDVRAAQRGAREDQPKIGPAHGAQSRPVATPSSSEEPGCRRARREVESRLPSATNGRLSRSAKLGKQQREPEHEHERERDPPSPTDSLHDPAAADGRKRRDDGERDRHADEQRQTAAPNGWSARVNTNGSTGRMHGLRIVSTPPRTQDEQQHRR